MLPWQKHHRPRLLNQNDLPLESPALPVPHRSGTWLLPVPRQHPACQLQPRSALCLLCPESANVTA